MRFIRHHESRLLPVEHGQGRPGLRLSSIPSNRSGWTRRWRPVRTGGPWSGSGCTTLLVPARRRGTGPAAAAPDPGPAACGRGPGRGRLGGADLRPDPVPHHRGGGAGPGGRGPWSGCGVGSAAGSSGNEPADLLGPGPPRAGPDRRGCERSGDAATPSGRGPVVETPVPTWTLSLVRTARSTVGPTGRVVQHPVSSRSGTAFNDSGRPAANLRGVAGPGGRRSGCPGCITLAGGVARAIGRSESVGPHQ